MTIPRPGRGPNDPPAHIDHAFDAARELIEEGVTELPVEEQVSYFLARLWDKGYALVPARQLIADRIAMIAVAITIGALAVILIDIRNPNHIATVIAAFAAGAGTTAIILSRGPK